jgi:hypothetical protein
MYILRIGLDTFSGSLGHGGWTLFFVKIRTIANGKHCREVLVGTYYLAMFKDVYR